MRLLVIIGVVVMAVVMVLLSSFNLLQQSGGVHPSIGHHPATRYQVKRALSTPIHITGRSFQVLHSLHAATDPTEFLHNQQKQALRSSVHQIRNPSSPVLSWFATLKAPITQQSIRVLNTIANASGFSVSAYVPQDSYVLSPLPNNNATTLIDLSRAVPQSPILHLEAMQPSLKLVDTTLWKDHSDAVQSVAAQLRQSSTGFIAQSSDWIGRSGVLLSEEDAAELERLDHQQLLLVQLSQAVSTASHLSTALHIMTTSVDERKRQGWLKETQVTLQAAVQSMSKWLADHGLCTRGIRH